MPIIEWNDSMSVGVKAIDQEHMHLIDIVNNLSDSIDAGEGHKTLEAELDNLVKFVQFHFQHEERLFTQTRYPDTKHHLKEHASLYAQIVVLQKKYIEDPTNENLIEVFKYFKKLFMDHAIETDLGFAEYLKEAGFS